MGRAQLLAGDPFCIGGGGKAAKSFSLFENKADVLNKNAHKRVFLFRRRFSWFQMNPTDLSSRNILQFWPRRSERALSFPSTGFGSPALR